MNWDGEAVTHWVGAWSAYRPTDQISLGTAALNLDLGAMTWVDGVTGICQNLSTGVRGWFAKRNRYELVFTNCLWTRILVREYWEIRIKIVMGRGRILFTTVKHPRHYSTVHAGIAQIDWDKGHYYSISEINKSPEIAFIKPGWLLWHLRMWLSVFQGWNVLRV
jgi:hypothetical protein